MVKFIIVIKKTLNLAQFINLIQILFDFINLGPGKTITLIIMKGNTNGLE